MYSKGIRKILIIDNIQYGHISKLIEMAKVTGHKAILHNGNVYVYGNDDQWIRTSFTIEDFKE